MKLLKIVAAGLFALALNTPTPARAQGNSNVALPTWRQAVGTTTQYYYIPELEGYYDARDRRYVLLRDGRWARVVNVSGYNPNNFHPVVIDYVGAQPWSRIREYKTKYPKAGHPHGMPPGQAKKMRTGQAILIDRNDGYEGDYKKGKSHGNGHGKSKGKDKD
ncbi:hypothetical protein [Hymenobacter elongatus]|uniref:Uncharacterized protein n=1 Tax=Hymenobacter elongatus TaxID=877208 RepID=A0A4Z0PF51_9BACT|nr:hypothetical protein [Hymenobacter elongatus]TGE13483.1 hypothetical protein E5J99_19020 [Hymenobacter elongatus]